ncbi:isoprenyl transferase [Streptomyces osmaniensis]|uniref:Isoprenyl transferase n=2 Tax=Streptomyces osmaniensis TaxID=593134 RepID=A0ABP6Z190_9ACTN
MDLLHWCEDIESLEVLTLWPLSKQNLARSREELSQLLGVIVKTVAKISRTQHWRIHYMGDLECLPSDVTDLLLSHSGATSHLGKPVLNLAIAYSGRDEITRAVQRLLARRRAQGATTELASRISAAGISRYLDTAGQPDPDLVIRTSGERRLSDFMPWQTAHSELYFTSAYWPDFSREDLCTALRSFENRERRYGR